MIVTIQIDTKDDLTAEDKAILRAVGYLDGAAPAAASTPAPEKAAAPAKKTAAKKTAAPEPVKEPEAAVPDDATSDLKDAAVARASELMSDGQRKRVLDALKEFEAPRVSEIPADRLQDFIDSLSD
jgi:hypothetical protein